MSQLMPAKPAVERRKISGSAHPQKTKSLLWWVLTIRPLEKDCSDAIVGNIITPLTAQARSWGVERSSFGRFLDKDKPHVELHLLTTANAADRLWLFAHALVAQHAPHLGAMDLAHVKSAAYPPPHGEVASPQIEAALSKYGGVEGIALTAEIAEVSSDLAAWAIGRFPTTNPRSALAALLLFDACHAMMRGPRSALWADRRSLSWDYYWDSHLRSSTASYGPRAAQVRSTLTTALAPRIVPAHRSMGAVASELSAENWRKRWVRAIDTYMYRADKSRISRSAQQLTMYQSHQLLNRLGIPLRDEAALGLYARAWSKEREEELVRTRP